MSNYKNSQTHRPIGFYISILAAFFCLVSAIIYSVNFRGVNYSHGSLFSDVAFIWLISAAALSIIMLFIRLENFAPVVLCIASGLSLLVYIHHMVWPIADIFTAIDPVSFIPELILCGALLLISFILSEVSLYMKKRNISA